MNALQRSLLFSSLFIPVLLIAQDAPPKRVEFGNVSKDEVAMKSFAADTNAEAVCLSDFGLIHLSDDMGLAYLHEVRLKILTKAGFDWADVHLVYYTDDHEQVLDKVEGATYTLAADGSVKRTPLEKDQIFEERYDDKRTRYKFTMPALEPGCVVEFRTINRQKNIVNPPQWEFQKSIPVVWSEVRMLFPRNMLYTSLASGYEHFAIAEHFDQLEYFSEQAAGFVGQSRHVSRGLRYALRDAPAVREEPFMTTVDDYIQKVDFQLSQYVDPVSHSLRNVLGSWESVRDELLKGEGLGKAIDDTRAVKNATAAAVQGAAGQADQVRRIYDVVRSSIAWDGRERYWALKDVDDVLESRAGNSADINTLLLSMLQAAGIESYPVVLSTRSNGRLREMYPIVSQFNYVVTCAVVDGKRIFLDATDRLRPMELLSPDVLNTKGMLLKKGPIEWVTLSSGAAFDERYEGTFRVGASGEVDGSFSLTGRDFGAVELDRRFKEGKKADKVRNYIEGDKAGLAVDTVSIVSPDSLSNILRVSGTVSSPSYGQAVGDNIYVNPMVVGRMFESPLTRPTRKFPLDLTYARKTAWSLRIVVPPGYIVKELPANKSGTAAPADGSYMRLSSVKGDTVIVEAGVSLPRPTYETQDYFPLRDFFAQVTSLQSDQVILAKAPSPAAAPQAAAPPTAPAKSKKGKK
jgi:transglutaminase-like putative cysteine protease